MLNVSPAESNLSIASRNLRYTVPNAVYVYRGYCTVQRRGYHIIPCTTLTVTASLNVTAAVTQSIAITESSESISKRDSDNKATVRIRVVF